jgi:predicted amidohydrolase YtcJ
MQKLYTLLFFVLLLAACQSEQKEIADTIITNGNVYTVNEAQPRAEAIAIKGDKILAVGSQEEIEALKGDETTIIDAEGQFVMPGFIEGHGHFAGLGSSLMNLNFLKSKSWEEIVAMVAERAEETPEGEWITGRGWHQEKWITPVEQNVLGYPLHDALSAVTPNHPVVLRHASGHSLFANAKAMELAGISVETPNPFGGEIVRDSRGRAIGVFEEKAMAMINDAYSEYLATLNPDQQKESWLRGIELAEEECLTKGITSFQDAGSSFQDIDRYKELADAGELDLRLWVMVRRSYDEMKEKMDGLPVIGYGNNFFTCKAIKTAVDGALGAFGAWLLRPYADKHDFVGQNTVPLAEVRNIAQLAWDNDMQLCVHAIGDKGNQITLDIMEAVFEQDSSRTGHRWRVEHAQHLDTTDIPRFREMGVIASMQGIHCTSDAPFVEKRLGYERAKYGAYPWRSLLDADVLVMNGTDAPVEDVSPIESYYASVTRKRADSGFEFFPEQAMTREEAIYSYTLANAFGAFEEDIKGSLEVGKLADIVILSNDLTSCTDEQILGTEVMLTMVGGQIKHQQ